MEAAVENLDKFPAFVQEKKFHVHHTKAWSAGTWRTLVDWVSFIFDERRGQINVSEKQSPGKWTRAQAPLFPACFPPVSHRFPPVSAGFC